MKQSQQPKETIDVDNQTVSCDGGGGALGHPLVYLSMTKEGMVDCPYCGRHFVQSAVARTTGH